MTLLMLNPHRDNIFESSIGNCHFVLLKETSEITLRQLLMNFSKIYEVRMLFTGIVHLVCLDSSKVIQYGQTGEVCCDNLLNSSGHNLSKRTCFILLRILTISIKNLCALLLMCQISMQLLFAKNSNFQMILGVMVT
ncbi:hypothetical protein L1887_01324 [Cichorium endivia]|nr:hypothetical protein L1887_01324 [Cichorium endivia]